MSCRNIWFENQHNLYLEELEGSGKLRLFFKSYHTNSPDPSPRAEETALKVPGSYENMYWLILECVSEGQKSGRISVGIEALEGAKLVEGSKKQDQNGNKWDRDKQNKRSMKLRAGSLKE